MMTLALDGKTSLSVAEALAVLLQTWSKICYQYRRFGIRHFADIEGLVRDHHPIMINFRQRSIQSLNQEDKNEVVLVFKAFEEVLGPVGAAKCLHLLAPCFFPLWDRAIAEAFRLPLRQKGRNAERYWRFMEIANEQVQSLGGEQAVGRNLLKAIDEYNYCKHTKGWI